MTLFSYVYNRRMSQQKFFLLSTLLFVSFLCRAQDTTRKGHYNSSINQQQADTNRSTIRYQTSIPGWLLHPGDTLQLGQGSRPTKVFAYLHEYDTTQANSVTRQKALGIQYAGRKVLLTQLRFSESNEAGGRVYGLIDTGRPPYYYAELDSAINRGEILPPINYRPSAQASPAVPVQAARELIKLKALLDAGTITKPEYNRRKAAILRKT